MTLRETGPRPAVHRGFTWPTLVRRAGMFWLIGHLRTPLCDGHHVGRTDNVVRFAGA